MLFFCWVVGLPQGLLLVQHAQNTSTASFQCGGTAAELWAPLNVQAPHPVSGREQSHPSKETQFSCLCLPWIRLPQLSFLILSFCLITQTGNVWSSNSETLLSYDLKQHLGSQRRDHGTAVDKNRKATNRKVELERTKHTFRQELCFSSETKRSIINHQLSFSVCERKTEQINNLSRPLMMAGYVVAKLVSALSFFLVTTFLSL